MLTQQRTPLKKNKTVRRAAAIIEKCHDDIDDVTEDAIDDAIEDTAKKSNLLLVSSSISHYATFTSFWDRLWCDQASAAILLKSVPYSEPFKVHPFIPSFYNFLGLNFLKRYNIEKEKSVKTKECEYFLHQAAFFGNFSALFIIVDRQIELLQAAKKNKMEVSPDFLIKLFDLLDGFVDYHTVPALVIRAFLYFQLCHYYCAITNITCDSKIAYHKLPSEVRFTKEQGILSLHVANYIQKVQAPICSPIIHNILLLSMQKNFSSFVALLLSIKEPFLGDPLTTLIDNCKSGFTPSAQDIEQEAKHITRTKTFTPGAVRFY